MVQDIGSEVTPKQLFNWQFSLKGKLFNFDPLLPAFLGFPAQKKITIGQLFNCFDGRQKTEISDAFKQVLATKQLFERVALINVSEQRCLVKISISLLESDHSIVVGQLQYLQAFPSVEKENEFLRKIFIDAENGRMLATSDHTIIMANRAFCEELGYQQDDLIGKSAKILKSGHYEPEFYQKLWETVDTAKVWSGELLTKNKQQEVYAREVTIKRFELEDGDHFYLSNSNKLDVPSSLLEAQVPADGNYTIIPDKLKYTQSLQQSHEAINIDQTIVVAAFSINWLQKISDYTACWLVSQRFQLAKQFGTLGLLSKGIYSIYWVESKNPDKIDTLLRHLLTVFGHGFDDSGFDLFSTVNMGVSILSVDAKNPAQLIAHSIQTLIANPSQDYSSLYYFDRRLATRFDRHQILAKLLRKALNQKSIEVYYQPVVEIPSLQIKEFKALLRIKLETEIDYNTSDLIHIAEAYNWIDEIDALVAKIAVAALPKIQKHYNDDDIAVAINRSLINDKATHCSLEDTIDILLASKADLTKVTVELAKSNSYENFDHQKQWVEELQKHGVKVAIDDFGTGPSSFSYLNHLPVNFIKIDRSFVTGITLESNEYAMIKMLCKLAHKIGVKVVAEGVETVEELDLLYRADVDLLQGYLFSKPISLEAMLASPPMPFPQILINTLQHKKVPTLADICIKEMNVVAFDDRLITLKKNFDAKVQDHAIILEHKKCVGVLYRTDYYAAISPYIGTKGEQKRDLLTLHKRVHQIMRKDFLTLHIDSDLLLAEQFFSKDPASLIVITNRNHTCLGITNVQALLGYQNTERNKIN